MTDNTALPRILATEGELNAFLAKPYPKLVEMMRVLDGDLIVLGATGKMGLSLAALAVNAVRMSGVARTVYGVSRFTEASAWRALEACGVVPLRADLLDPADVATLPRSENVVLMAGRKFGTSDQKALTWATNTVLPSIVCEHFKDSRIVAFSTGCVYPLVTRAQGGCTESDAPAPVGEYAQSCLGRERVLEYFSGKHATPMCLLRLNYSLDLRYGVLHDIADRIWQGRPVDRSVAFFNGIWQGDANNQALLSLMRCESPAALLNLTGPETVPVVEVAEALAGLMGKTVTFSGTPGEVAYLNDASKSHKLFGTPRVPFEEVLQWTATWICGGGRSYGKPTHFEVVDGQY